MREGPLLILIVLLILFLILLFHLISLVFGDLPQSPRAVPFSFPQAWRVTCTTASLIAVSNHFFNLEVLCPEASGMLLTA